MSDDSWRRESDILIFLRGRALPRNCNFMFPPKRHLSGRQHATFSSKSKHFPSLFSQILCQRQILSWTVFIQVAIHKLKIYSRLRRLEKGKNVQRLTVCNFETQQALCFHYDSSCPLWSHCVFSFWRRAGLCCCNCSALLCVQCSLCAFGFIIGKQYCAVRLNVAIVLEIVVLAGIIVVVLVQCI